MKEKRKRESEKTRKPFEIFGFSIFVVEREADERRARRRRRALRKKQDAVLKEGRKEGMAQKLQLQLKEVGSKLETPPSTKDSLVKLLKVLLPTFLFCLFFSLKLLFLFSVFQFALSVWFPRKSLWN